MKVTEPEDALQYTALYQATVQQAVGGSGALMARLVAHTRGVLRTQEDSATERRERDRLTDSRRLLNQFESALCGRFTEELKTAFARMASVERAVPALHFDQLAGMDESQLQDSVQVARAEQAVRHATDPALAELNGLVCAMLGLAVVELERNPLRPSVYVEAMTAAMTQLPVPPLVRQGWTMAMTAALGQELEAYYRTLSAELRARGVAAGVQAERPSPAPGASGRFMEPPAAPRADHALLTLEKLRRLLSDHPHATEVDVAHRYDGGVSSLARGDSGFEAQHGVPTGFRATVPAAFEAVKEMKQLDEVVERVEQRKAAAAAPAGAAQALRAQMRGAAHGLEQSLGLEVVAMMVDNITHDRRLLAPVQELVATLEPALLQLALVDPRFFSHKQHPARRLLHEITHRSIAFESIESRGFSGFMEPLREAVAPLAGNGSIGTAEPFDAVLERLVRLWDDSEQKDKRQLAKAVKALRKAEQRNALAGTIAMDVLARKDAALVPDAVLDFLCGPWAQVVAHARMVDRTGAPDPGHYAALIDDLMWSAQPPLTRKDVPSLTRLVPKLLGRLRAGLATVDFPPHKTSEFFEVLMHLHQRGFKADAEAAAPAPGTGRQTARAPAAATPWVAPVEARASGFIDLSTEAQPLVQAGGAVDALQLGSWVALMAEGGWTRTRLTWTSPSATLLLFTDALGYMQSLTRRACEQLLANGHMHLLTADPVEDALDAVAQVAMRNSVDVRV